jgi:hypothetical protein
MSPQLGRVSGDKSPRPPARVPLEQRRRPGSRPTLCPRRPVQEKRVVPAASAASRRASFILLEKSRSPLPLCPCRRARVLREKSLSRLCRLAASHATKTCVPTPGRAPYSRKARLAQKPYVSASRRASCLREALRPRHPARALARKTLCQHGLGTRPTRAEPSQRVRVCFVVVGRLRCEGLRWQSLSLTAIPCPMLRINSDLRS